MDTAWRGQLLQELIRHQLAAEAASDYGKAKALLEEHDFAVVIVDVPAGSITADYIALNAALKETSSVVVVIGASRPDDAPGEWFEVLSGR
ncbi:MAG TPA: hypothetical protein VII75_16980 [Thermoanaerobaculia bacterium]|nr:hypothetical protein [Thermoanaerobaculia bacterium]